MKKHILQLCGAALLAAGLVFPPPAAAAPVSKPWRIALVTGGPFIEFQITLQGLAQRLAELGLIANGAIPMPEHDASQAPMLQWLAENAGGDTLHFVADALYSPEWNPDRRAEVKNNLLERLRDRGDIDCILAFGGWAGQDIAPEDVRIPVLVLAVPNAVAAGIVSSADDSGRDNLLAAVDPGRYERHVQVFHKIIGFSRLGIAYEDTPAGRDSIALKDIEAATGEEGVELLRCTTADLYAFGGVEEAMRRRRACHEDLVRQGADAVYITYQVGMSHEYMPYVLEPLIRAGLPTFDQQGSLHVQCGVMLGMTSSSREEGFFAAAALEQILKGSLPRSLSQRFESTLSLAVNLYTAALIGWNLPMEVLAAVDEFYRDPIAISR